MNIMQHDIANADKYLASCWLEPNMLRLSLKRRDFFIVSGLLPGRNVEIIVNSYSSGDWCGAEAVSGDVMPPASIPLCHGDEGGLRAVDLEESFGFYGSLLNGFDASG